MRVLALLSGGKDSVAAIEVAQGFGWDVVVALAIRPAEDDAWMFHTPNLEAVRGVAQCLGLPLVESPCRAGAQEEVEDLAAALAALKVAFRLDGVISGALASEYQRTRIDAIGHRLGLKTFAPLWHKEPGVYLAGLMAGGYQIHFSRVAAEGLPLDWAGAALTPVRVAAMARNAARPHIAGEGGEYETVVLDAPHFLRRLVVTRDTTESSATRATWMIDRWHTESRDSPSPGPL